MTIGIKEKGASMDRDFIDRFDARSVNVIKITSVVDCEILSKECDFAINQIDDQLSIPGFGDRGWVDAAETAKAELSHKKGLASIKAEAIKDRMKQAVISPEAKFATKFVKSASEVLPADVYKVIFELARSKVDAQ